VGERREELGVEGAFAESGRHGISGVFKTLEPMSWVLKSAFFPIYYNSGL
jgi:hypothetical protein